MNSVNLAWWPVHELSDAFIGQPRGVLTGGFTCPICREHTADKVADHCHATLVVREWICRRCNAGLGMFRDDPTALRAAAAYIEVHKANPRSKLQYTRKRVRKLSRRQVERATAAALKVAV